MAREEKVSIVLAKFHRCFGPSTPKVNTPQFTITEPHYCLRISKLAGERWCEYYFQKFECGCTQHPLPRFDRIQNRAGWRHDGLRCSYFFMKRSNQNLREFSFREYCIADDVHARCIECNHRTDECWRFTWKFGSSYNIASMSFTPKQLSEEIRKTHTWLYNLISRMSVSVRWFLAKSIDDSVARTDWGWKHEYDLAKMTKDMLEHIQQMLVHWFNQNNWNHIHSFYKNVFI